jgi:serine/threonine protein kinase/predicted Zn-dependent protease
MGSSAAIPETAVCRSCGARIRPEDSYSGYCFGCLLTPALDSSGDRLTEKNIRFDHYEILTHPDGSLVELGRGAMGVTYKAVDVKLRFPVALKVINPTVAGAPVNRERFLREAQAAARLRHPHVASVLYYGVQGDGQCFYTMEFVDGETLATRVERSGPLPVEDALEMIAQVAKALTAAEQQGVVHRDLKPANLMLVKGDGINVKVIDFGLAKLVGDDGSTDSLTQDGFVGTPAFASPEQFAGAEIDRRSDYFSLGSTLFYALTGRPPFKADRLKELGEQIGTGTVPTDRLRAAAVPRPVRDLVASLLSADPAKRPQTGRALGEAIANCQRKIGVAKTPSAKRGRLAVGIIAALGLLLIAGAAVYFFNAPPTSASAKSIAVLPFDNFSPNTDESYFADGVQDEILTNLAKVADLQVISRGSVQAYRNPANRPSPGEIGSALHVRYLVSGSVRRAGDQLRVTAQLVEATTGREVWAERYEGNLANVFAIQTQIAREISQEVRAQLSAKEKESIEGAPTHDVVAYQLYLQAKQLFQNYDESIQQWDPLYTAVRLLDEATTRDPNFVLAWCLLAEAHDDLYWYDADHSDSRRAAAQTAIDQAMRLHPDSGEVHLALAIHLMATRSDYTAVRRELEIARQTLPNSSKVIGLLAKVDASQGKWRDAVKNTEKAIMLDPKSRELITQRNDIYQYHRRYEDLRRLLSDSAAAGISASSIDFTRAAIAWQEKGDTSACHTLLDPPVGPFRAIGRATLLKVQCALADRNFDAAKKFIMDDPRQEFEAGDKKFFSREYMLAWIERCAGNEKASREAYMKARPLQQAYVEKWPGDPNPLIVLAITDAGIGRKDDAIAEARDAVARRPLQQDAVEGPLLAEDLAQVYLWVGEREEALKELEALKQVPRALTYGYLAKVPTWDALRSEPRFQKLLSELGPIPIENTGE